MANIVKDIGAVSAYALAREKGYTGTEEEFALLQMQSAENAEIASRSANEAKASKEAAAESAESASQDAQNVKDYISEVNTAGATQIAAVNAAGAERVTEVTSEIEAASSAAQTDIENKKTAALAEIPETYTDLSNTVTQLKESKADGIVDTSARAASHELHAQMAPLNMTVFGKTTETGSGDKSPDNPYTISGVDDVRVQASGKNLFYPDPQRAEGARATVTLTDGVYTITATGNDAYIWRAIGAGTPYSENDSSIIPVIPGEKYAVTISSSALVDNYISWFDENKIGLRYERLQASSGVFTVPADARYMAIRVGTLQSGATTSFTVQVEHSETATAYEPYNANVKEIGTILPDGSPLYGNGTVDDTVEFNLASGCDRCVTFEDATNLTLPDFDADANVVYSDTTAGITVTDGVVASTLTYPCKVWYRSTEYTPEKDIRVTKVTREWKTAIITDFTGALFKDGYIAFNSPALSGMRRTTQGADYCNWLPTVRGGHTAIQATPGIQVNTDSTPALYLYSSGFETEEELNAHAATNPLVYVGKLDVPKIYMTDRHDLRKPYGIMPVTVTGSGETAVEYIHDTKHYIDTQIAAAVALLAE